MLDEMDEEDVRKIKYVALFGVGVIVLLGLLLLATGMLGSEVRRGGSRQGIERR